MTESRDSSVGITTDSWLDDRGIGVLFSSRARDLLFFGASRQALELPSLVSNWFREMRRPEYEAGCSPLSIAKVNARSYTSTPQYVFMPW
jgi:hypothetical protein